VINVGAAIQEQRTHPEIMQDVPPTRDALNEKLAAGDQAGTAADATRLAGLYRELLPLYDELELEGATELAVQAATAADEAAAAANAGNMEAAASFAGTATKACGGCHMQFREKTPDGSYRIKVPQ
jgi:hypothetical protein